jgi:hypothetical protein
MASIFTWWRSPDCYPTLVNHLTWQHIPQPVGSRRILLRGSVMNRNNLSSLKYIWRDHWDILASCSRRLLPGCARNSGWQVDKASHRAIPWLHLQTFSDTVRCPIMFDVIRFPFRYRSCPLMLDPNMLAIV